MNIILASSSPQRKRILQNLGVDFKIIAPHIDEHFGGLKRPFAITKNIALRKALAVAKDYPDCWVIGCDTIVVLPGGKIAGKPKNRAEAKHVLMAYSNAWCDVYSGIALINLSLNKKFVQHEKTRLHFFNFSDKTADDYLDLNQWQGSSGSMTIEGEGGKLIKKIAGEYWNVVGLPVRILKKWLKKITKYYGRV
jgi:septum formation protein